jgi:hypothetical protein
MCQLKNQQLIEKLRLWKDVHEYLILNVLVSFITLMKTLYNQCIEMDETSSYFTTASTIALKQYTPPDSQRNPLLYEHFEIFRKYMFVSLLLFL